MTDATMRPLVSVAGSFLRVHDVLRVAALIGLLFAGPVVGQATGTSGALAEYALGASAGVRHDLPASLAEISGLAATEDGRLFAHNDELARVLQIDPGTGAVVMSFSIGNRRIRDDFEGLAIAHRRFYMVSARGRLLEFLSGEDGQRVLFREYDTGLGQHCEVEGLEYDAPTDALLLACKTTRGKALAGRLVVFAYSIQRMALEPSPRYSIPLDFLTRGRRKKELSPSGIAVHPRTGTFFVVAAREHLLLELARTGEVLAVRELDRSRHPQPEGIAFLADGTLIIADERANRGLLTTYPPGTRAKE
jgi:uncharacterized protein YjiK